MHYKPILHEIQMGDYSIIVTEKKKKDCFSGLLTVADHVKMITKFSIGISASVILYFCFALVLCY